MNEKARSHWLSIGLGVAAGALLLAALLAFAWYQSRGSTQSGPAGPAYEGTKLKGPAPDFRLVDQNGETKSLADFRGRVVVLAPLNPLCKEICPLYALHFRLAYRALGQDAAQVAFLAVNANDERTSIEDVMAATKRWGADGIPSWHYLTGDAEKLRAVWKAYGISVSDSTNPDDPDEKQHTPAIFVIDRAGGLRWYLSTGFEGAPAPSALIVKHVKLLLAEGRGR